MVKCRECGLLYLNPRPALEEMDEASRTGLHKFATGRLNAIGSYSKKKVKDWREKLCALVPAEEFRSPSLRWLDVGAGFGDRTGSSTDCDGGVGGSRH